MKRINSKSILECNEEEMIIHEEEIQKVKEKARTLPNYVCMVMIDDGTIEKTTSIKLHSFRAVLRYVHKEKGIDLYIDDDNNLYVEAFDENSKATKVTFIAVDENMQVINIGDQLI